MITPPAAQAASTDSITKTFAASDDSYASSREPNSAHGQRSYSYATGGDTVGWLKFDTAGLVPAGYAITSVQLKLDVVENDRPAGSPVVNIADNGWSESSLVEANQVTVRGQVSSSTTAPSGSWTTVSLSATTAVNPDAASSFAVTYDTLYSNFRYATKESGSSPQLIVTLAPTKVTPANPRQDIGVPAQAKAAGYNRLSFDDEFNSLSTIDLTSTGVAGKNWYLDRPFGYRPMSSSDLSISDGALVINQSDETGNWGMSTESAKTHNGTAFQYGYMEMRMAFDPANAYKSLSYPSFWSVSEDHFRNASAGDAWSELDVFEAYHLQNQSFDKMYVGTVHDMYRSGTGHSNLNVMNSGNNTYSLPNIDFTKYHTYGVLWSPGQVTWYFDGQALLTQKYGSGVYPTPNYYGNLPLGAFSMLDGNKMVFTLGSGPNNPMKVDYMRVYQA